MDEDRRRKQRAAKAEPDNAAAAAAVNADDARMGEGVIGFLLELVGKQVWIEGVRINYRGILRSVLKNHDGSPAALVLHPFQRISYFQKNGPDNTWTFAHSRPHLVPYECIHDVGEEGFDTRNATGWEPLKP